MPDSRITVRVSDILLEVHISTIAFPLFCTFNFRAEKNDQNLGIKARVGCHFILGPLITQLIVSLVEALHLGTLMAAHGYFFPISDHVLTLKDDGTFYRFQVSCFADLRSKIEI